MKASFKKNLLIGIIVTAGIILMAALGWFLYFKMQFTVYQDDQYKFSIEYPKTWKVLVHPKPNVAVIFVRPKDTALDTMEEKFSVCVFSQVSVDHLLTLFRQFSDFFGKNVIITQDKPMHWGWREGHIRVIEAPKPDRLIMVNAWVTRVDEAFIMSFMGSLDKKAQDSLVVDEMIRSLKLQ